MSKSDKKDDALVIKVCCDSKCSDKGSRELRKKLKKLVEDRDLEDRVKVKKTDCLDECSDGPAAKAGKKTVTGLKPKKADAFLDEALARASGETKKKSKKDNKKKGD